MHDTKDVVIKVAGVYKNFRLPHEKATTLKSMFTNLLKGKRNRTVGVQHALKDISFEIKRGEFFGIVGRNGSGKSTLLKILAGIYQPTKGNVSVLGKLVPFIELGVGFNPELTGRENVYLNGSLLGFSRQEIEVMYDQIVEFAELKDFMDQKLKNYSSGMQVRLAFAMAIRAEADILLVDEVLAVGDADFQRKCFEYFRRLKKAKKTVVFVSHDMNAVREYCDRAILIEKSSIIATATASKVASQYTRMFIDEAFLKNEERQQTNSKKRWGSGGVTYKSADVVVTDENIFIKLEATTNQSIENPNFGFSVKDASGQTILGTNSQIKGEKIGTIDKGVITQITWEFPNILKDDTYFVELAVVDSAGAPLDWWEEAVSFTVLKEEKTPYIVNPRVSLKIGIHK